MKEISSHMVIAGEPLHEFWNKAGFVMCTNGSAEVHINDRVYRLTPGCVFVVTPLIQIYDIKAIG